MNRRRFLVKSKKSAFSAIMEYGEKGILSNIKLEGFEDAASIAALEWLLMWTPATTTSMLEAMKGENKVEISELPEDLSFERFWDEYGYKVGKKDRTIKLWNELSDTEKAMCLAGVKKYRYWLSHKSIEQLYPETFLRNRRWDNEFKI